MTLQLSGQSESLPALLRAQLGEEAYQKLAPKLEEIYGVPTLGLEPHREFYGQPITQMPLLVSGKDEQGKVVDIPRDPASFAYVLQRRMEAPLDVRKAWKREYICTGDGSTAGTEDDHLIVFDAQALREMTPESELYDGALVLPTNMWQELKSEIEKDDSKGVYLNAEEVGQADGQGYVKKNGVWTPANRSVAKAWDALSKGRDLTSYIQLVSKDSPHSNSLLNVYFNRTTKDGKPTMRSWVAGSSDDNSDANGNYYLNNLGGRLVGIAPELSAGKSRTEQGEVTRARALSELSQVSAREKALEARVQSALESKKPFEFDGGVYTFMPGVSLK